MRVLFNQQAPAVYLSSGVYHQTKGYSDGESQNEKAEPEI
jgi:hypothetical protein